jgi:hypothetical protein
MLFIRITQNNNNNNNKAWLSPANYELIVTQVKSQIGRKENPKVRVNYITKKKKLIN